LFYHPDLGNRLANEQQLIVDMRYALEDKEFELYFQPQLCLHTNKIFGVEVLIRWFKDEKFIPPNEFIPLAERSGFIVTLGQWILRRACEYGCELIKQGYDDIVVAVNISPRQFGHSDFLNQVKEALDETGLPAANLELEITEGVIIYNEEETITLLNSLKALGVKLSIDDFGTGYSSLSYLKKFTIDKLKIDQSFIRQIQSDDADRSIVRTVIDLGRNLGLSLIAEGVEEESQLTLLKSMGCDEIQGYFYSRPIPFSALTTFLAQSQQAEELT
jgi:EAL domain-containing protein (putative c-di-GMP-specific phosphodiesterase class I)